MTSLPGKPNPSSGSTTPCAPAGAASNGVAPGPAGAVPATGVYGQARTSRPGGRPARLALLEAHDARVEDRIARLRECQEQVRAKIDHYRELEAEAALNR